jgi:hypothetical protein
MTTVNLTPSDIQSKQSDPRNVFLQWKHDTVQENMPAACVLECVLMIRRLLKEAMAEQGFSQVLFRRKLIDNARHYHSQLEKFQREHEKMFDFVSNAETTDSQMKPVIQMILIKHQQDSGLLASESQAYEQVLQYLKQEMAIKT